MTFVTVFDCSLGMLSRLRQMTNGTPSEMYTPLLEVMCKWGKVKDVLELISDWLQAGLCTDDTPDPKVCLLLSFTQILSQKFTKDFAVNFSSLNILIFQHTDEKYFQRRYILSIKMKIHVRIYMLFNKVCAIKTADCRLLYQMHN